MLYRFYKAQVFTQHVKRRLLWMTLLNGNEWCFWTWMMTGMTRILGHVNVVLHWPTMTEHGGMNWNEFFIPVRSIGRLYCCANHGLELPGAIHPERSGSAGWLDGYVGEGRTTIQNSGLALKLIWCLVVPAQKQFWGACPLVIYLCVE